MGDVVFDAQNKLNEDVCYQEARDRDNARISAYYMTGKAYGAQAPGSCSWSRPDLDHRNLYARRGGYGVADGCVIDADSTLRNNASALTNPREKHQLFQRLYQAGPDLNSGIPRPDVESRLLQGELDVSRSCTGGVAWDRPFINMLPCVASVQDAAHIVPDWTWGGEPTRDYVRRPDGCSLMRGQGGAGARGPA